MDLQLSEERRQLQASVEQFVEDCCSRERVAVWDRDHSYPESLYQQQADNGYLGLMIPEEWGGAGGTIEDAIIIYSGLAKYTRDIGSRVVLTAWGQQNLLHHGTPEQKKQLLGSSVQGRVKFSFGLTEPEAGSDAAALRTRAVEQPGGTFLINGQKSFCSGAGAENTVIVLAARTDTEDKHGGVTLFLVPGDAAGLERRRMSTIGCNMLGTYELFLTDVEVGADAVLGGVGNGWHCIKAHLTRERIMAAALNVGNAATVVADAVKYANERVTFGKPIIRHQAIAHLLADMVTALEAGRWLTNAAAWRYAQGLEADTQASMAKLFTSEALVALTANGMQILGGSAYTTDHAMQRYWRDSRMVTIGGGTSQIMRDIIGRSLAEGR